MSTKNGDYTLENAADLAIAVLWNCATNNDHKFSTGVPTDSVYTSYYSYAYGNAFVKVSEWLLDEYGVTYGYSKNNTRYVTDMMPVIAEMILERMADCGPEPVRALRRMVNEMVLGTETDDLERLYDLLRPDHSS